MTAETREESLPVDVSDEPLVGWRCWYVLPHEALLRPIFKRGLVWKPRQAQDALCPEHAHEPPADDCKCGIWTVCHPMLLDEIGWTTAPPSGTPKLPGVLVVGEVALWGKIIQHERGWRASAAYPRHLYVFTDEPMLPETLRERYGIPVEWGPDAERLRRLLPAGTALEAPPAPTLRDLLLDVLRGGLCSQGLEALTITMLDAEWGQELTQQPSNRQAVHRVDLSKATSPGARRSARWYAAIARADSRALEGSTTAARRGLWVRLANWRRKSAETLLEREIQRPLKDRDTLLESLARGTSRRGQPYAPTTLADMRRAVNGLDRLLSELGLKIDALMSHSIPTYREWCAIARGTIAGNRAPVDKRLREEWHRRAVAREARLVDLDHELAIKRQQLMTDRAAFQVQQTELATARAALDQERAQLREEVVAGVERDRDDLLREVGALEMRRRAALALLREPNTPPRRGRVGVGYPALAARLRQLQIPHRKIATVAACSRAMVAHVLTGKAGIRRGPVSTEVLVAARALVAEAERVRGDSVGAGTERPAVGGGATWALNTREELVRERTELDALRRRVAAEQAVLDADRATLKRAHQTREANARRTGQASTFQLSRHVAAELRPRLAAAGISQTRLAKAAGVTISQVCHVLAGRAVSIHVVAAAERMLAKATSRPGPTRKMGGRE